MAIANCNDSTTAFLHKGERRWREGLLVDDRKWDKGRTVRRRGTRARHIQNLERKYVPVIGKDNKTRESTFFPVVKRYTIMAVLYNDTNTVTPCTERELREKLSTMLPTESFINLEVFLKINVLENRCA